MAGIFDPDLEVINAVRAFPCLYDPSENGGLLLQQRKENAWRTISEYFNPRGFQIIGQ